jgi:branched-chain amino acid aminotransferase
MARGSIPREFPRRPGRRRPALRAGDFRGLKAYKRDNGVNLFRPDANARRFKSSAERMATAPLEDVFIEAVEQLVRIDSAWIPGGEGSLYLRPFMIASEVFLGVKPSAEYIFAVIAARRLLFQGRTCAGVDLGVGELHTRRDRRHRRRQMRRQYAASLRAQAEAIEHGCDQVVFSMRSSAATSRNSAA